LLGPLDVPFYDGSKFVAVFGDPEHRRFGYFVTIFLGQDPSLFRSLVPIRWFIWAKGHGRTEPPSAKNLVLKGVFDPVRGFHCQADNHCPQGQVDLHGFPHGTPPPP
jgi:hypothetical protein